jgi:multiple sugar transport system permease protein
MILPATAYVFVVAVYPLLSAFLISFFDYRLTDPEQRRTFVGLANYSRAFLSLEARVALVNTIAFVAGAVALEAGLGLAVAILLQRDNRLNQVALALLLIPMSITPLVVGLLWKVLYNADFGVIGYYALALGVPIGHGLPAENSTALASIVAVDVWEWTPLMVLIFLAGLKSLPREPFEAALADGATAVQRFWYLTLPMLRPVVLLALVFRSMDAFKIFDVIFAITQGGPGFATTVLNFYIYKQGLTFFDMGYASALSNMLLAIMAVLCYAYIRLLQHSQNRADQA